LKWWIAIIRVDLGYQPFLDEILGDQSHFKNYLGNIALTVDHVGKIFDEYPEFDMATMVVTLHEIPPDVRMRVLEKAYQALKGDGLLLILDFLYPSKLEDFRNPMYDYGILDQFFETCAGFIHLSAPESEEMLTRVGFKNIQRRAIGKGMFELVTATK